MLITRSYSRVGNWEAALRAFAILTLQRTAGRSSETAWLTWEGMRWDPHFKHVFMEVPQPKKSKVKLVALGAGISRHADWFVTLGDYLALQPPTSGIYKEGSAAWVFPNLQLTGSPGTTMGNYIRALLPLDRGGHIKYQDEGIVLHDLPPGAWSQCRGHSPWCVQPIGGGRAGRVCRQCYWAPAPPRTGCASSQAHTL